METPSVIGCRRVPDPPARMIPFTRFIVAHVIRWAGQPGGFVHVLFVCTGNICRSPTAERLAAEHAQQMGIPDFTASSAGTHAVIGHPIHPNAAAVLTELGGDASGFAARQLNPKIAAGADLILTMTRSHRDAVLEIAPGKLRRTFTVCEASKLITEKNARDVADLATLRAHLDHSELVDIPDPIGQGPEVFATVGAQIAAHIRPILELFQASYGAANG